MTMQRVSNLPDTGAKLQAFNRLEFTNGVTGVNTVHNLTSLSRNLNDTPVSPWEAIYNLLSGVDAGHPLRTFAPTSTIQPQSGYLTGSTITDLVEVRQNLFDSYSRGVGRGNFSNLLNHANNASLREFMELAQLGVRGNALATAVNAISGDFEVATIQDAARQNVRVFRRKSTGGSPADRAGWQNLGWARVDNLANLYLPQYTYHWTAAANFYDTRNVIRFSFYVGVQVQNVGGAWTRTRAALPITGYGSIPARGYALRIYLEFPAPSAAPFYAWRLDGSLIYKETASAGSPDTITDLPPYSASDNTIIASRDGNFSDTDSAPEWDTVLPWTPAAPPTGPETPPQGPTTPAQNSVLDSTTYAIQTVYDTGTHGPSKIMPFVRATPGNPKIVARFWVQRTRTYVNVDAQGNRTPANPPQIVDPMPHAGGVANSGTLQLAAPNRSRPYPEGSPADGSGASIISGWPTVSGSSILVAAGRYVQGSQIVPNLWQIDTTTPTNSTILGGASSHSGQGIVAATYRESDNEVYAVLGNGQLCTLDWNRPPAVRGATITNIGSPIRVLTSPVVIPTLSSIIVAPSTGFLIGVGAVTLTTSPYTFATHIFLINETNPDQSTSLGTLTNTITAMFVLNDTIYGINTLNSNLVELTISGTTVTERVLGAIIGGPGNGDYFGVAVHNGTVYITDLRGENLYTLDVTTRVASGRASIPAASRPSTGQIHSETTALFSYGGITDFYKAEVTGPHAPDPGVEATSYGADTAIWELQINPGPGGELAHQPAVGIYDNLQMTVEYSGPA